MMHVPRDGQEMCSQPAKNNSARDRLSKKTDHYAEPLQRVYENIPSSTCAVPT